MVISPELHKKAVVDHTPHDTTSILTTIEHRWGLDPLSSRDAAVADLGSAFGNGGHKPRSIPVKKQKPRPFRWLL
jgi:phospholipase C